jgi:hypothetical protein
MSAALMCSRPALASVSFGYLNVTHGLPVESNTPRLARAPARTKSLHVAYSPTLHLEGLPKTHPSDG